MRALDVSVQICTLNEEGNIRDVIRTVISNSPAEILVVDGGSTDRTVAICQELNVRVIEAGPIGLAAQRQTGIDSTHYDLVALVDADDRLPPQFLPALVAELRENNLDGIDGIIEAYEEESYWQRGWANSIQNDAKEVSDTNMLGRPALYQRQALIHVGFDSRFRFGSEDTDLAISFERAGFRQGHGTAVSFRIHEKEFRRSVRKWLSYGAGYAQIVEKHPHKRNRMLRHCLWGVGLGRYFTKFPGSAGLFFFYLMQSMFVSVGFLRGSFR